MAALDVDRIRADFPVLSRSMHGRPLVFLDSAASAQKPRTVIDAVSGLYEQSYANIHRGVYELSQEATNLYEGARDRVREFLNAASRKEIVFVRGTTEAINLVAESCLRPRLREGDEILVTRLEHHSNIVPWQMLCERTGAKLQVAPITDDGELIYEEFERLLNDRTRLVAVTHVSNAIGTVLPVERIVAAARERGAFVLLDGAQAVPHFGVDVQALGCDFYAFSGHKLFGPSGIGVLYARAEVLEEMEPYQGGGDMILSVSFEKTVYNELPYRFEAGTPHIAGAVGLATAIDYVESLDAEAVAAHEADLLDYGTRALQELGGVRIVGNARNKIGVLSFVLDSAHPHDIGSILDHEGVAIRTGHHCAQPLLRRLGVPATARASFAFYNTRADVDALAAGLRRVQEIMG